MATATQTHTAVLHLPGTSQRFSLIDRRSRRRIDLRPRPAPYVIGSGASCDLTLDDPYVSKRHCAAEVEDGSVTIRDLSSKNGTRIGGARVRTAKICASSQIGAGHSILDVVSQNPETGWDRLVGASPALVRAIDYGRRAARSDCSVLILGETGTGKELFARAIHECSRRSAGPFVALNCGAIPGELVAAELFGHARGAFTGASNARDGVFVRAHGGTLFLDELGELPLHHQPHLLRVLEQGVVTPVGGEPRAVDVRIVAATNQLDIDRALRDDLYHRLATILLDLPPLRERRGDIAILLQHFIKEIEPEVGPRTIRAETIAALERLPWSGNVRELRAAVVRAAALCGHELTLDALRPWRAHRGASPPSDDTITDALPPVEAAVRNLMESAYRRHGTIRSAAASLGMAKSTFADKAHRYGIIGRSSS